MMVTETLGQLSRPSLRRAINYMLNVLQLSEDKVVVDSVIAIRNRLVHTGQFISPKDSKTSSKLGIVDTVHEFYLLRSFVDRVLLRTFGYSGAYVDYSTVGQVWYPHDNYVMEWLMCLGVRFCSPT